MSYEPLASEPIGYAPESGGSIASLNAALQTVISQYASSPIILEIVNRWSQAFSADGNVDAFYSLVWDVDTAQGYGLDVLGRIVGVGRVLRIPTASARFGWRTGTYNFGHGYFAGAGAATQNYALADAAFRRLILAKAALNICDGSIPAINQVLLALFPNYGNCYVRDNGGMSMTYVFGSDLNAVDYAIVTQSGVLPKPLGVTVSAEQP